MQNLVSTHPIYQQPYSGGLPLSGNFSLASAPVLTPGEARTVPVSVADVWSPQMTTGGAAVLPALTPSVEISHTTATASELDVNLAADEFARATWRKAGTDMAEVSQILETVFAHGAMGPFSLAVARLAQQDGKPFEGPGAAVKADLASNPLKAFFNQAPLQEVEDLVTQGHKTYRSSPVQYRLRGMWDAVEDFFQVWNRHKVLGTLVMGLAAMLGRKFPFVGGLAGGTILASATMLMGFHEMKARSPGAMTAEKAHHYEQSGENLTAFLMTLIGVDGIKWELQSGWKVSQELTATLKGVSFPRRLGAGLWQALRLRSGPEHKPEGWRFLIGLFDEVLMPFNHLAGKSKKAALPPVASAAGMSPVSA